MSLKSKISAFNITRKVYKNPWSLLLKYLKHEEVHELELKSGIKITADKLSFVDAYPLAKLLNQAWYTKISERNYVTLCKEVCIKARINEGFDLRHILEIFEEKVYGHSFINYIVIDVGASNGDSSIFFALNGAKRVIAIEPFSDSYNLAVENVKMNKLEDRVTVLNYALSDKVGEEELILFKDMPNAATINKDGTFVRAIEEKIKVKSFILNKLMDDFSIETIDLLKMDCEGCEYKVFRSLDPKILRKIKNIYMEYHKGFEELKEILESNSFEVTVNPSGSELGYLIAKSTLGGQ